MQSTGRAIPLFLLLLAGVGSGAVGTVLALKIHNAWHDAPASAAALDGRQGGRGWDGQRFEVDATNLSGQLLDDSADIDAWQLRSSDTRTVTVASDTLREAAEERAQLAEEVLRLQRQVAELQRHFEDWQERGTVSTAIDDDMAAEETVNTTANALDETAGTADAGNRETGNDHASLRLAGLDEQSALALQARRDRIQLDRLDLLDQAAREGWSDSPELAQRLDELQAGAPDLRLELGDDAYDRYLQAEGRSNRVRVASVIPGSAADQAGIAAGDLIIRYDDSRIFRMRELREATQSGTRGEMVSVSIERDGQLSSTQLPRGPLGITMRAVSREP